GFGDIGAAETPVSNQVLLDPVMGSLHPRRFIKPSHGKALAPVEGGVAAIDRQVAKVHLAARRKHRGEMRRRAVVDIVAPGVGADELEGMRKTPGEVWCQSGKGPIGGWC